MIYEFDIRAVFKDKRSVIYCGIVAGAIFAVFSLDIFGYDKYVPANDKLDNAAIFVSYNNSYTGSSYDDKWNYIDENDRVFKEMKVKQTEVITDIAHKDMGKKNDDTKSANTTVVNNTNNTNSASAEVCYTLKNGKKVYRTFDVDYGKDTDLLNKLFADTDYKAAMSNINSPIVDQFADNMSVSYSNGIIQQDTGLNAKDLISTYRKDYNAMTFSDIYEKIPVGYIELKYDLSKYESRVLDYPVYQSYVNTIDKLKSKGIEIEGHFTAEDVENISINNYNYTPDDADNNNGGGMEKTYDDKNSIGKVCGALVPSDISSYGYACGNLLYDSCDATVTLTNSKGKYNWSPVSCMLLKEKTPNFVKTDLHIDANEPENPAPDELIGKESIVQEITGTGQGK
jgi:ABC-2 type transport system permease protein